MFNSSWRKTTVDEIVRGLEHAMCWQENIMCASLALSAVTKRMIQLRVYDCGVLPGEGSITDLLTQHKGILSVCQKELYTQAVRYECNRCEFTPSLYEDVLEMISSDVCRYISGDNLEALLTYMQLPELYPHLSVFCMYEVLTEFLWQFSEHKGVRTLLALSNTVIVPDMLQEPVRYCLKHKWGPADREFAGMVYPVKKCIG